MGLAVSAFRDTSVTDLAVSACMGPALIASRSGAAVSVAVNGAALWNDGAHSRFLPLSLRHNGDTPPPPGLSCGVSCCMCAYLCFITCVHARAHTSRHTHTLCLCLCLRLCLCLCLCLCRLSVRPSVSLSLSLSHAHTHTLARTRALSRSPCPSLCHPTPLKEHTAHHSRELAAMPSQAQRILQGCK